MTGGHRVEVPDFETGPVVDTTGDRDLLCAAYAWADLRGADADERLSWAQLYSRLAMGVPTATGGAVSEERLLEEGAKRGLSTPSALRLTAASMGIRAATAEDAAAIAEVFVAAATESWGEEAPAMEPPPIHGGELVAEDDDGITGFAIVKDCEIDLLFTHPRAWGRGAGRALVVAAEDALRDAGCAEVSLWTEERNAQRPPRLPGLRLAQDDGLPRARLERRAAARAALPQAPLSDGVAASRGVGLVVLAGVHGPGRGGVRGRAVRRARAGGRGVRAPRLRRGDPRRDLAAAAARAPARRPPRGDRVRARARRDEPVHLPGDGPDPARAWR